MSFESRRTRLFALDMVYLSRRPSMSNRVPAKSASFIYSRRDDLSGKCSVVDETVQEVHRSQRNPLTGRT